MRASRSRPALEATSARGHTQLRIASTNETQRYGLDLGGCLTTKPTDTSSETYETSPNADEEDRGRGKGKTVLVSSVFTIELAIEFIIESTIEPTI